MSFVPHEKLEASVLNACCVRLCLGGDPDLRTCGFELLVGSSQVLVSVAQRPVCFAVGALTHSIPTPGATGGGEPAFLSRGTRTGDSGRFL